MKIFLGMYKQTKNCYNVLENILQGEVMIHYNAENRMFHLQSGNVSYVFFADRHGFLRHLYFGEAIPAQEDILYLSQTAFLGAAVNFDGATMPNDNLNAMLLENSCSQLGDYRRPSVEVLLPNGSRLTDFRYNGYKILQHFTLSEMPFPRDGETLEVQLSDSVNNLDLYLYYTVFDDCDVVVRNCKLVNNGKNDVTILKLSSFMLDLYDSNYDTVQLVGNWAGERQVVRNCSHGGILQVTSSGRGVSSHCHNPFLALVSPYATENEGEAIGVNLLYSGSFSLSAENSSLKICRLQGGIDSDNFRWLLQSGSEFYSPAAVMAFSAHGLGEMSRAFHNFYRKHVVNPKFAFAPRPIVVNNWEATYFDFDTDKLFEIIDCAKQIGADAFVLDDGWFTNRNNDTNGLGDWQVNTQKLRGGLKQIAKKCHDLQLKFGLWIEPEMVNEGTELFRTHPEWVLHNPDAGRVRGRNQLVLDFANPEVVEHIFRKISDIIGENDVDYVKWDMNRYLADLYSPFLPAQRQGEVAHRYVLGVYSLAQKLTQRFPDVLMEGCSGGGGRFDGAMLYYFPQIWTSDNTDAYCRTFIQQGTSLCYPQSAMSAHYSVCPNHQTGRTLSSEARYNVACTCSFGYELDICKLSEEEKAQISKQIADYRTYWKLVSEGDLYRLSSTQQLWAVCQVLPDKSLARVVGLHGLILENQRPVLLKIHGLEDDFDYLIQETGQTVSGKTLRSAGILLPQVFSDFATFALHLKKAN